MSKRVRGVNLADWQFILEKWVLRKRRTTPYEPRVMEVIKRIRGDCFLDVGANVGVFSLGCHKNFRRVHAFEPNPSIREELISRAARKGVPNLKVWPYALSDTNGKTTLFLDPHVGFGGSVDSILPEFDYDPASQPQHAHVYRGQAGVEVETRTIDSLEIPPPFNLVKIDVEGAEFQVLRGAKETLAKKGIHNLIIELHTQARKPELEALLKDYGYTMRWIDPDHIYSTSEGEPD